jgi:hypothetical protein
MERKKLKGVIFKIDFEKAYDSVNWGFSRRGVDEKRIWTTHDWLDNEYCTEW